MSSHAIITDDEVSLENWRSARFSQLDMAETSPTVQSVRKLLLVDGHAYAYRAFYAIRDLKSPEGRPTNAIYGFLKMIEKLRAWVKPTHIAVVWDGGLAAERMESHPDYKADRPPMPGDLEAQVPEIIAYLEAAKISSLQHEGVEADDWIGALARQADAEGAQVLIASSDKDFMQLVSERIGLVNPNDKSETVWTRDHVMAKSGVAPGQIVDWLSLVGDSVDNIPGVPGIGPKTAADLLQRFGTLECLYQQIGEVKSERTRRALAEHEPAVRRNQKLIRLHANSLPPVQLEDLACKSGRPDGLRELYARWGFRTLLRELETAQPRQEQLL